ncbi:MAG: hypothetical protein Q4G67_12570, partial [Actinomycetia bacterium]|nr:hypothetical protein [Actinomycetes bacterium]
MIILGLILVVLALLLGTLLVLATNPHPALTLDVFNQTLEVRPLSLVIAGAIAMTLLWWGWALLRIGTRRRVRKSREAKEAARQAELDREAREKENQAKWERELRQRERHVRDSESRLADEKTTTPGAARTDAGRSTELADERPGRDAANEPTRSSHEPAPPPPDAP